MRNKEKKKCKKREKRIEMQWGRKTPTTAYTHKTLFLKAQEPRFVVKRNLQGYIVKKVKSVLS